MNKPELVSVMSEKSGLTKKDTETVLKAFIETVEETVASGEKVQIVGFGTFEQRERAARMGRNPSTKEEMEIPASKGVGFKAGSEFKNRVKNK